MAISMKINNTRVAEQKKKGRRVITPAHNTRRAGQVRKAYREEGSCTSTAYSAEKDGQTARRCLFFFPPVDEEKSIMDYLFGRVRLFLLFCRSL
jgi:hypothetical protein